MKKSLLILGMVAALGLSASAQIPYAYGLKAQGLTDGQVADGATTLTVNYSLNAPSTAVAVEVYSGTELVKTVDLSATAENLTAGAHEVAIAIDDLKAATYTWKVNVKAAAVTTPTAFSHAQYQFWSPYGIAVDNNTESDNFGRILVTECQPNMKDTYWTKASGVGVGVYAFDPQLEPIKNANGTNGFNGGLVFDSYQYEQATQTIFGLKKVKISKDGRIFVGSIDMVKNPIYEIDPDNLDSWTPLFVGTKASTDNTNGNIVDAEGKFIGGLSVAFDIMGEGESLKLVNLSATAGQSYSFGNYKCYQYNLGTAKSISTAVTDEQEVMPLSMQYTISAQAVSIAYDKDGGIWYCQYRGTPTESQPAVKHIDASFNEDYSDITTVARGGGVAFNNDYSILAMPTANNEVTLYTVDKDASNKPVLTKLTSFASLRGCNDIAFDYAGNFYTCDNGKELFGGWAIPQSLKAGVITQTDNADPAVVTPAPSKYAFTITTSTGVEQVAATSASITAGVGFIEVSNAQNVQIYSINGALVSTANKAEVPAGIYVVRADGKAVKVLVK